MGQHSAAHIERNYVISSTHNLHRMSTWATARVKSCLGTHDRDPFLRGLQLPLVVVAEVSAVRVNDFIVEVGNRIKMIYDLSFGAKRFVDRIARIVPEDGPVPFGRLGRRRPDCGGRQRPEDNRTPNRLVETGFIL